MKQILLYILSFLPLMLLSQIQEPNGYFISEKGEMIQAHIYWNNEAEACHQLNCADTTGKKISLSPEQVKYYKVEKKEYFSFVIESGVPVFLKRVYKDSVNLFVYTFNQKSSDKGDVQPDSVYYLKKSGSPLIRVHKNSFRKDMSYYFSDCPDISEKIADKVYRYNDLLKIVSEYCECKRSGRRANLKQETMGYAKNLYNHTFDLGVGVPVAASKDFSHSFTGGLRLDVGYNFPLSKGVLLFKPRLSWEFFSKNYTTGSSSSEDASEKLQKYIAGGVLKWNFYKPTFEDFNAYFQLSGDYVHYNNWLKFESGSNIEMMYSDWYQIGLGIGGSYSDVYFEAEYFISQPKMNFFSEFRSMMIKNGYYFTEDNPILGMNTFLVTVGIHFRFKKEEE